MIFCGRLPYLRVLRWYLLRDLAEGAVHGVIFAVWQADVAVRDFLEESRTAAGPSLTCARHGGPR